MYLQAYFRQDKDQAVRLPVKWLALEALTEGVFSEKSDVVSCVDESAAEHSFQSGCGSQNGAVVFGLKPD